jgi:hypothetical protein
MLTLGILVLQRLAARPIFDYLNIWAQTLQENRIVLIFSGGAPALQLSLPDGLRRSVN